MSEKWINWIEEAIAKRHIKYYEYKDFSNIEEIGCGSSAKIVRANWKDSAKYYTLKSFYVDNITAKEIVHEVIINIICIFVPFRVNYYLIKIYICNLA